MTVRELYQKAILDGYEDAEIYSSKRFENFESYTIISPEIIFLTEKVDGEKIVIIK